MADYNIYIHSAISGTSSPTQPWSSATSNNNKPWASDDNIESKIVKGMSKASSIMMNPDGLISQGVGMLAKAVPWIAIAIIIARITDRIVSTANTYNALETGDYRDSIAWNNFKANLSWVFKPFSTTWNEIQVQNRYRVMNYRQNQQRALLGDSVINSYTNRGV